MTCTGAIPTLGYPTRFEAASALAAEGLTPDQIAERIGTSRENVWQLLAYAKRRRRNEPRTRLAVPNHVLEALHGPAIARGVAPATLARRILSAVARDDLTDAILDDRQRGHQ